MSTPSARSRLMWPLDNPRKEVWKIQDRKSSMVFTHKHKYQRAKRFLSQSFIIQFPEDSETVDSNIQHGPEWKADQLFMINCSAGPCTAVFIRTDL